jgi:hypothetical protein
MTARNGRGVVTEQSNLAVGPPFRRTRWFIGGVAVLLGFYALALAGFSLSWPRAAVVLSVAVGNLGVAAFYYARTRNGKLALVVASWMEILWAAVIVM